MMIIVFKCLYLLQYYLFSSDKECSGILNCTIFQLLDRCIDSSYVSYCLWWPCVSKDYYLINNLLCLLFLDVLSLSLDDLRWVLRSKKKISLHSTIWDFAYLCLRKPFPIPNSNINFNFVFYFCLHNLRNCTLC